MRYKHEGSDLHGLLGTINNTYGSDVHIVDTERTRVGGVMGFFSKEIYRITVEVADDLAEPGSGGEMSPKFSGLRRDGKNTPKEEPTTQSTGAPTAPRPHSTLSSLIEAAEHAEQHQSYPPSGRRPSNPPTPQQPPVLPTAPPAAADDRIMDLRDAPGQPHYEQPAAYQQPAHQAEENPATTPQAGRQEHVDSVDPLFSHLLDQAVANRHNLTTDYTDAAPPPEHHAPVTLAQPPAAAPPAEPAAPIESRNHTTHAAPQTPAQQYYAAPAPQVDPETPPAPNNYTTHAAPQAPAHPQPPTNPYADSQVLPEHTQRVTAPPPAAPPTPVIPPTPAAPPTPVVPPTPVAQPEPAPRPAPQPARHTKAPQIQMMAQHKANRREAAANQPSGRLAQHLSDRGLPDHLVQKLPSPANVEDLLPLLQGLPEPPRLAPEPGTVAVVLSMDGQCHGLADRLAHHLSGGTIGIVPTEMGVSESHGRAQAQVIRRNNTVGVIEVVSPNSGATPSPEGCPIIKAIDPNVVIAAVDARLKHADVASWLQRLFRMGVPIDAIAVTHARETCEPATVIGLDVPIWELDGALVDKLSWLPLLLAEYRS